MGKTFYIKCSWKVNPEELENYKGPLLNLFPKTTSTKINEKMKNENITSC